MTPTVKITLFLLLFLPNFSFCQTDVDPSFIKSIYFGGGSYYIDYQQITELQDWLDGIEGIEQFEIVIHSHTDNIGSLEYNQWLSQMRSGMTKEALKRYGIREEMLLIQDYGEESPVYDNATMDGKLRNRRVDVILKPPIS